MAAVTICSDFGAPQNKVSVSTVSPSVCHGVMGLNAMILVFWKMSFKPIFSPSSLTFIKRLFSSLLSAIRVASSVYLRLLIFLPANNLSLTFLFLKWRGWGLEKGSTGRRTYYTQRPGFLKDTSNHLWCDKTVMMTFELKGEGGGLYGWNAHWQGAPGLAEVHCAYYSSLGRKEVNSKIACSCHGKSLMLLMKILLLHEIFSILKKNGKLIQHFQ